MSKFEEISNNSSGVTTGNSSSSESSEDSPDLFRAKFAAMNEKLSLKLSLRANSVNGNGNGNSHQNGSNEPPSTNPGVTSLIGSRLPLSHGHSHGHGLGLGHGHGHLNTTWNTSCNNLGSGIPSSTSNGMESSSVLLTESPKSQLQHLFSSEATEFREFIPKNQQASLNLKQEARYNFVNCITRSNMSTAALVIKDVWQDNLYEEFVVIRKLVHKYNYIAMDTEFPGVVIWLDDDFRNSGENQFDMIRTNVDALKLIQLGISFMDENGTPPPGVSTWQFNFKFDLLTDLKAQDSIDLLKESGLQFDRHQTDGIDPDDFCELFICSGLVLNSDVYWITYHGGYDFGYLMRILLGKNLPTNGDEFSQTMKVFFPCCYDVKVMLSECGSIRGGLQDISLQLGVKRIGTQHQAGSDSLLTGMTFFQIKQRYFGNSIEVNKYNGKIYGLSLPEPGDSTG